MTIRPALKSGVYIHNTAHPNEIRIGTRWRYTSLPFEWNNSVSTRALISLFDGKKSIAELEEITGTSQSLLLSLIEELCRHDFVDLHRTPVAYLRRYNPEIGRIEDISDLDNVVPDFAIASTLHRIETECDSVTFSPGDIDGGRSAILKRRQFQIIIFGKGKIVNFLVGVLSASGYARILVINRVGSKDPSLKLSGNDVAGGFVTRQHYGATRKKVIEEIKDSSALFHDGKTEIHNPDLIISIGAPQPDAIQRWMVENTRYLLVDITTSSEVRIGPLVNPGKSACIRCLQLSEENEWQFQSSPEVSAALAMSVAAAIAHDVNALSNNQASIYHQTSQIVNTRNYSEPQIQRWSQHHACGCGWNT
jgi:hypothetical protein